MSLLELPQVTPSVTPRAAKPTRGPKSSLLAQGEPMVWLTGGALAIALAMIIGLTALVVVQGSQTFWPKSIVEVVTRGGKRFAGELFRRERFVPTDAEFESLTPDVAARIRDELANGKRPSRSLYFTGNFDVTGNDFEWVNDDEIERLERRDDLVLLDRRSWGRYTGLLHSYRAEGADVVGAQQAMSALLTDLPNARQDVARRESLQKQISRLDQRVADARMGVKRAKRRGGDADRAERLAEDISRDAQARSAILAEEIRTIDHRLAGRAARMVTVDGKESTVPIAEIIRVARPNAMSVGEKLAVYGSRLNEFLLEAPREANTEGGVFPAIWGTMAMTIVMSLAVAPFGVLAALYLREYAKAGAMVSTVRIAVNNLAGVPSIVFGVFGLGFFCQMIGGPIDQLFFPEYLPDPTFGRGGLLWASLTLALLTLPVVIVATEEAIAAVPNSMREGSFACGASKWQTIRRIVLPRAMPGIMTGMILAMARGAGEVAPLMLVGAVKLAPDLPVDDVFPYVHPHRSFMHLGLLIYDRGFQSRNSEAARPTLFAVTLLLMLLIGMLNLLAIALRSRLRRRYATSKF